MSEGFRVDLGALDDASSGITDTLAKLQFRKVSDLDPQKSDIGHGHLADVLKTFCTRWELGVENLAKDAQAVSQRLNASVKAYREVDGQIAGHLSGTLSRDSGADPGAK
ncbi:WXG100 family type VII secretion target [Kitasatospora sp. NPDC006697]|uniref:WXG100 family type VII secretion target n=1 Tax=Kitasatospora sp. NPDC006697 TaxID=3364020 RepID=UPI00367B6336